MVFPDHTVYFLNAHLVRPKLPSEGPSGLFWKFYWHGCLTDVLGYEINFESNVLHRKVL